MPSTSCKMIVDGYCIVGRPVRIEIAGSSLAELECPAVTELESSAMTGSESPL